MIRTIGNLMVDWFYLDERIDRLADEIEVLARRAMSIRDKPISSGSPWQHNQLQPERSIFRFKSALGLERTQPAD